jgi:regulator of PEP synthase PpsR (kinase-PPPase family)
MLTVFVVSGSTGITAERVARAAISQFEDAPVELIRHGNIRTAKQVREVVREAKNHNSLIFSSLVDQKVRRAMAAEARRLDVDSFDVLGPIIDRVAARLKLEPLGQPGLLARSEAGRLREIEAIEYAFRHDDGKHVDELNRAELVLVGVSRSMKTPTTLYLAYRGWFAANVPLILEVDLPPALVALPGSRVYYLFMEADRLRELRRVRSRRDSIPSQPYTSMEYIRRELQQAGKWCSKYGWRKIDVTCKSVEEVSREIILLASG